MEQFDISAEMFVIVFVIEVLIKFLETIPQIPSIAMNVVEITIKKMADTSKDELILGGGICHVTAMSQY